MGSRSRAGSVTAMPLTPDTSPQMHVYKGYHLLARGVGQVSVEHPGPNSLAAALYRTTSLAKAKRWVDAYRDGRAWAVQACLDGRV